jgi:hypothetical protein
VADQKFTAEELAACAEREVRQREYVYPRRIASGNMTQALATKQTGMMRAIAERLRAEADAEAKATRLI